MKTLPNSHWIVYDGTSETLPEEGMLIILDPVLRDEDGESYLPDQQKFYGYYDDEYIERWIVNSFDLADDVIRYPEIKINDKWRYMTF